MGYLDKAQIPTERAFRRMSDGVVVAVSENIVGSNGENYVLVKDGKHTYHMRASFLKRSSEYVPVEGVLKQRAVEK